MSGLGKAISAYGWTSGGNVAVYGWDAVDTGVTTEPQVITSPVTLRTIQKFRVNVINRIICICLIADKQIGEADVQTNQILEGTLQTKQSLEVAVATKQVGN